MLIPCLLSFLAFPRIPFLKQHRRRLLVHQETSHLVCESTRKIRLVFVSSHPKFAGTSSFKWFNLLINILDQVVIFLDGCIKNSGKKIEVFFNSKILVQRKPARHISNNIADFFIVFYYIKSYNCCRTAVWQQKVLSAF